MIEPWDGHLPVVDPSAFVHEMATLIGRVSVGEQSSIWPSAVLRGDDGAIEIGACTSIQDGAVIHATTGVSETRVGSRVTVGHRAVLHGCVIEDDALVGMGSIVLDNAKVCRGAMLGAGTLVPMGKEVPGGVLAVGSPFRVVRDLSEHERQWIELSWRTYVERVSQYRRARGLPA